MPDAVPIITLVLLAAFFAAWIAERVSTRSTTKAIKERFEKWPELRQLF
jgi:hypothetical protein